MGHNCEDNPPRKPKKKWQQKAVKQVQVVTMVETQKEDTKDEAKPSWTIVDRQRKGKGTMLDKQPPTLICDNIFYSLKALHEPLVINDNT